MNDARRQHEVMIRLNDTELARLDEIRGTTARATHLRRLVYEPPGEAEVATRCEALGLLSRAARSGSVTAAIALERALRDEEEPTIDDALNRILAGGKDA
jgi:hypothetical protein